MLALHSALLVAVTALVSCGGRVVVDGSGASADDGGDDDGLGGAGVTSTTGTSSLGAGAASPNGPSASTATVGGATPGTPSATTASMGNGGSVSPGLAACLAEAELPPDLPCVGCAYPLTYDACFPEHMCQDSVGLYAAILDCICGGPSQPGVCSGPCGAACSGTGPQTQGCDNCIVQGCIHELSACANDV